MPKALILANVGTPDAPTIRAVRKYLREFLSDPAIIHAPAFVRWFLANVLIAPLHAHASAEKYRHVWLPAGSPLLVNSNKFAAALQTELGADWVVTPAMRYGEPSFGHVLGALQQTQQVDEFVLAPLFPQPAPATTDSAIQHFFQTLKTLGWSGPHRVLPAFATEPDFIASLAAFAAETTHGFQPDHWLFSFHGLPESHLKISNCHYREDCQATAGALAAQLKLPPERWSLAFQSRFGPVKWIGPHTADVLRELPARGVRRLAVVAPSFVADCLETLEELAIRGRKVFLAAGGINFCFVPCLNTQTAWVKGFAAFICAALRDG